MLKKDARFHYGIKCHNKGSAYADDYLVTDEHFKPLSYIYKESAQFIANKLTIAHGGKCSFKVVRLD